MDHHPRTPIRRFSLGLALFAIGIACRNGVDALVRIGALLIGAVQLVKLALDHRLRDDGAEERNENALSWIKTLDNGTAILLIATAVYAVRTWVAS